VHLQSLLFRLLKLCNILYFHLNVGSKIPFALVMLSELRELELKYLRGRKYLDALCVYFWATTPVLISIFTFVTYVLLGNKLTAATVSCSTVLMPLSVR
jgi:ATP-binding cassette subfamily C (CFTR/MRP) protein 10